MLRFGWAHRRCRGCTVENRGRASAGVNDGHNDWIAAFDVALGRPFW